MKITNEQAIELLKGWAYPNTMLARLIHTREFSLLDYLDYKREINFIYDGLNNKIDRAEVRILKSWIEKFGKLCNKNDVTTIKF